MAIPETVIRYLDRQGVHYDVVRHPRSASSWQTVITAHVDPDRFAKAVLLYDEEGYFLAVLPASRDLDMRALARQFGRRPEIVAEEDLARRFPDCALGAVPALGPAYRVDMVVDSALRGLPEVWFEAGDHEDIIRLEGSVFEGLLGAAWFGPISKPQEA